MIVGLFYELLRSHSSLFCLHCAAANINGRLGDGVNCDDQPYHDSFPFIGSCPDGRNRRHRDPGERLGGPVD